MVLARVVCARGLTRPLAHPNPSPNPLLGSHVAHYRAYIIGRDGHFRKAIDLDCIDDEAAKQSARQLVNREDVELWQRDRKIPTLTAIEPRK
jgi:hypothetical protein